jgi:hypothetical protein
MTFLRNLLTMLLVVQKVEVEAFKPTGGVRSHGPQGAYVLEAKPLRQGQKTRILGQQSKSCSHLYNRLPAPSHQVN